MISEINFYTDNFEETSTKNFFNGVNGKEKLSKNKLKTN